MSDDAFDTAVGAAIICALAELPEKQRYAVIGHLIRGETLDTLAARQGVSRSAIGQSEKHGLAKLARTLAPLRDLLAA